jgi:3-dehydroquinate synthase
LTADLRVPEGFSVSSHKGQYEVHFDDHPEQVVAALAHQRTHFIVDANVARLHAGILRKPLSDPRTIIIEATEENKSIERIVDIMRLLVDHRIRRDHELVAIGGGIIQDITCFIASTMLRGIPWRFLPTTLLAQTDSCIGSKSSVNLGTLKNILGTFNPPSEITISGCFLDTLLEKDMRSGIGEIIKVHAIDSAEAFDRLAVVYDVLLTDRSVLVNHLEYALKVKRRYIEIDEFDQGVRNVFNYGHSFGHAIETATNFTVPHGIAVTMGMQIANDIAAQRGVVPQRHYARMHKMLAANYGGFETTPISLETTLAALGKDKKNTSSQLVVILPVGDDAVIQKVAVDNDPAFQEQLRAAIVGLAS